MHISRPFAATTLALLLSAGTPGIAQEAEDNSIEYSVPYEAAIRCSAYNVYMAAILEDEGAEEAAYFDERGVKWLALAYARDGENGKRADKELEPLLEQLAEKVEKTGSGEDLENFLTDIYAKCEELANLVRVEFDAVVIE